MSNAIKTLSSKEKEDLSWKMLENIIEKVKKFSDRDKKIINQCGKTLRKHGVVYQHNVDREAKVQQNISKSISQKAKTQKIR